MSVASAPPADSIRALEHDHAQLTLHVLQIGALIAEIERGELTHPAAELGDRLVLLRDDLFLHFVREEEGLFPLLHRVAPDLAQPVADLIAMHDEICGAVARMVHLVGTTPHLPVLVPVFRRFEAAYAKHAAVELELLQRIGARLTVAQRRELHDWIRGL